MKKKNKIILLILTLLVILSLFFLFYFLRNENNSLSLQEKQWIEKNKNNVVDVSVLSNIPALTYQGEGLIFDYLNYVAKETGLTINPVVKSSNFEVSTEYSFNITNKVTAKDILIYTDNYVLISKENYQYDSETQIKDKKIGILDKDYKLFNSRFGQVNALTSFKSLDELSSSYDIDSMIVLKSDAMPYLIKDKYNINYQFNNNKYYVLRLNGSNELNNIFKKEYANWYINYNSSYNQNLLKDYYSIANVDNASQAKLDSKTYTYGFVINGIYDYYKSRKLDGYNKLIIKNFSEFSGATIKYKNYNNYLDLSKKFNNNKIDIAFNNFDIKLTNKYSQTSNGIDTKMVLISSIDKKTRINSINDLKGKTIYTIKNSKLESYLKNHQVKVKTFDNTEKALKNINNHLLLIDLDNYDFYKTRYLKNCKIDYVLDNINYNYIVKDNDLFSKLFVFYINYVNIDELIDNNYATIAYKTIDYTLIILVILVSLIIVMLIRIFNRIKKTIHKILESKKETLTKEEKLKYIDQLTSLKNRTYLNSKVEEWDESKAYPQCVIVIDLNNISYINDNYGREEGDKVIRQAANVLIQNQIPNSEIIRTDGNEFLIYSVGYKEKDIVTYLRKISRELKHIDYGYGAAYGYSMIVDEIKTLDDAINEATLDMKQGKEDNK